MIAIGSAPRSTSNRIAPTVPLALPTWSGVSPQPATVRASAPASSSARIASQCPCSLAQMQSNGVHTAASAASTSAPACSSSQQSAALPNMLEEGRRALGHWRKQARRRELSVQSPWRRPPAVARLRGAPPCSPCKAASSRSRPARPQLHPLVAAAAPSAPNLAHKPDAGAS